MVVRQKYSKLGLVTPAAMVGVEQGIADILCGMANFGLSANTWKSYECIINNLARCEEVTGKSMQLPFESSKMLTFVGWMIERGLKASSMNAYISALRMYHLALGYSEPVLREPIVKLTLKGKANWDKVQKMISGEVGRLPVTNVVLKLIKKELVKANIQGCEKVLLWACSTIMWNGSFRVHEILARNQSEFDPQTTLLWEDVKVNRVKLEGKTVTSLSFKIKSPKVDRVGTGDFVEIFETGLYNCPVKAFHKWRQVSKVEEHPQLPVFRVENECCYTGKQLNKRLGELTTGLNLHIKGGKVTSHSFRAGISSEMCRAGYSEQDIKAVGRWSEGSDAWKLYCKLPKTHRAKLARSLAMT